MASDSSGLYLFGFILLLILGVFAYSFISKHRADDKRKPSASQAQAKRKPSASS